MLGRADFLAIFAAVAEQRYAMRLGDLLQR